MGLRVSAKARVWVTWFGEMGCATMCRASGKVMIVHGRGCGCAEGYGSTRVRDV